MGAFETCGIDRPRDRPDRRPHRSLRETDCAWRGAGALIQTHVALKAQGQEGGAGVHPDDEYCPARHGLHRTLIFQPIPTPA
jgi:hypothetical protein